MVPVPRITRTSTPIPSISANANANRTVSFRELMPPPPPPIPHTPSIFRTPEQRLVPVSNELVARPPTSNFPPIEVEIMDVRPAPQIQSMTLNVEHPGTYAVTLDFNPCVSCGPGAQQTQRNAVRQVRQLFNQLNHSNGGW